MLLSANDPIRTDDLVATPADGRVALRFPGATSVRLDLGSRLRVLSENAVELLAGAVYIDTGNETRRFEVRTVFATARDIGTQLGFGWGDRQNAVGGASSVGSSQASHAKRVRSPATTCTCPGIDRHDMLIHGPRCCGQPLGPPGTRERPRSGTPSLDPWQP